MPLTKILAAAVAVLAIAGGFLFWRLEAAHEKLGAAKLAAAVNGETVKQLEANAERNEAIDRKLAELKDRRADTIKEVTREIYIQPASDACRQSAPMRALDGKLRYDPGRDRGVPAAGERPAPAVPAPGR